jgi:hypothetical protein
MAKPWSLLVLVSLKYGAEKRLLKTHVPVSGKSGFLCVKNIVFNKGYSKLMLYFS